MRARMENTNVCVRFEKNVPYVAAKLIEWTRENCWLSEECAYKEKTSNDVQCIFQRPMYPWKCASIECNERRECQFRSKVGNKKGAMKLDIEERKQAKDLKASDDTRTSCFCTAGLPVKRVWYVKETGKSEENSSQLYTGN